MQKSIEDMITRQGNAKARLVDAIKTALPGASRNQATAVAGYYLKHKIARLGANDGQFRIKHGAFFEVAVIKRAIKLAAAAARTET